MKKTFILCLLLISVIGIMAANASFVALKSQTLVDNTRAASLTDAVRNLDIQGAEIYYYNENYIVARLQTDVSSLLSRGDGRILPVDQTQKLYLITKLGSDHDSALSSVDALLDLGSSILIQSKYDEVSLRSMLPHPFVMLSQAMKFSSGIKLSQDMSETRTSIEQLTALVSADSIQTFIQHLQDFQTRYAYADNRLAVATWIRDQFIRLGITNAQLKPFQWQNTTQYNVEATIPGTISPDEYIIVGGHHDSILNSGDASVFAPGADDNASGTVAAIEMARVMQTLNYQPKCSIRFVTFAAEEFGLWGSKDYATQADNNDMNIRLMINHDMIAYSLQTAPDWLVRLMPYDGCLDQSAFAAQLTETYTSLNPVFGSMNSGSSDSHPFWQHGFPVIYFFEHTFTPNYHTVLDLVANLNPVYCAEVIKASVASAVGFANMPAAPNGLTVSDTGSGTQLQVTWELSPDPVVDHYNLYYSLDPAQMGNPVSVQGTSHIIGSLTEGNLYHIQLAAVDALGNESYRREATGTPWAVPLAPEDFTETPLDHAIRLEWSPNQELDLAGYQLYKSTTPGQIGSLVSTALLTNNFYTDSQVTGSSLYYYYTAIALDTAGNPSPYTETLSSRPITLDQGVLIVDETRNMSGTSPFQPSDLQADSYFADLMQDYTINNLDTENDENYLRLADLCVYSSILWHGNDTSEMDYPFYVHEALQDYLEAGGNVLFTEYLPSQAFELSSSYPAYFGPNTFINNTLGIASAEHSNSARFRYAIPQVAGYPALEVDSLKTTSAFSGHIIRVEGISPNAYSTELYKYGSDYPDSSPQGSLNDLPVGVLHQTSGGKAITLSFPLYNMQTESARALLQHVFTDVFQESSASQDENNSSPVDIILHQNFPNPFSGHTTIKLELKEADSPLCLKIYNLKGQLVQTIFQGMPSKGENSFSWDGTDESGRLCAPGIYLIQAMTGALHSTRKALLLR